MFTLNQNTNFIAELTDVPVRNVITWMERDRDKVFAASSQPGGSIVLVPKSMTRCIPEPEEADRQRQREAALAKERYTISISEDKIVLYAQGELGFIYGLLYLSEHYMGIRPFWFWMDQMVEKKKKVMIPEGVICSRDPEVLFRGWHFSDATLMSGWKYHENGEEGWKMCLEALLRCGGNTVVAGEGVTAEEVQRLAEAYGLYQTPLTERPSFAPDSYAPVFCYNLQKTNHVTMLPYCVDTVIQDLDAARKKGQDSFWAVQCSNLRPHLYFLDVVRKKWRGTLLTKELQAEEFVNEYFSECEAKEEIAALYCEYAQVMVSPNKAGERSGEFFYTENVRLFCHQLLIDKTNPAQGLCQLEEEQGSLAAQIQTFGEICKQQKEELEKLCLACTVTENRVQQKNLLSATIGLHIKLHQTCRRAARCFARGFESLLEGDYERAFLRFGDSAVWFDKGDALLRGAEYGIWKNFYANDCITDIKHTAYMVRKVMGWVRELGDNAAHDGWYQHYCLSGDEQMDAVCPVAENHKTDVELYEAMKKRLLR